ncbi:MULTISPECIES: type IV pilus modification protein PilV [Pseudomonas]|uniref:Type IV pilus modification protein PilV n=1 Tax=Pseudomonas quercus TaxID=2722792 RepID=A0ABX0YEN8_9PSED|nr:MULTISPECIES: type IV pilus modification protein PilV [Pseudomonas]MBF7142958.1 type IV pilus modification protein PilV [Pseudomonas sp. LY10J]NJP01506.1 type IV pilus modification protein PilV [Pseudomonas quercus]
MKRQAGITLIEVLVAMLIMTLALLGAAALQLNSLKYTDSARIRTQASFVAYDMMERIRANNAVDYTLPNLASAPTTPSPTDPKNQDLYDFANNVKALSIDQSLLAASVTLDKGTYTVSITWDDSRAGNTVTSNNSDGTGTTTQRFVLTSRVIAPPASATTTP